MGFPALRVEMHTQPSPSSETQRPTPITAHTLSPDSVAWDFLRFMCPVSDGCKHAHGAETIPFSNSRRNPPVLEKDISPVDKSESFIEVGCDLRDPADQKHSEISARRIVRHAVTREHSHEQS